MVRTDFFEKAGRFFDTVYGDSADFWRKDGISYALNPTDKPVITDDMNELVRATVHALYIKRA
jgi:hypothetical protein